MDRNGAPPGYNNNGMQRQDEQRHSMDRDGHGRQNMSPMIPNGSMPPGQDLSHMPTFPITQEGLQQLHAFAHAHGFPQHSIPPEFQSLQGMNQLANWMRAQLPLVAATYQAISANNGRPLSAGNEAQRPISGYYDPTSDSRSIQQNGAQQQMPQQFQVSSTPSMSVHLGVERTNMSNSCRQKLT